MQKITQDTYLGDIIANDGSNDLEQGGKRTWKTDTDNEFLRKNIPRWSLF